MDSVPSSDDLIAHDQFLRTLVAQLAVDGSTADDVSQQTWLTYLQRRPGARRLDAWLVKVARNLVRRSSRSSARTRRRERVAAKRDALPSTDDIVARESVRRAVIEELLRLEEPYREALLLHFYLDLPVREVAHQQEVPVDTARSRVRRGLLRLRERLGARGHKRPASVATLSSLWKALSSGTTAMTVKSKIASLIALVLLAMLTWVGLRIPDAADRKNEPQQHASGSTTAADAPTNSPSKSLEPGVDTDPFDERQVVAPQTGTLLVEVTWPDGGAAAGIPVAVAEWGLPAPLFERVWGETDGDGHFVTGLSPGRWRVRVRDQGDRHVIITARERSRAEFAIRHGVDVSGRVEDERGNPVAGAEVVVCGSPQHDEQELGLANTAADGTFELRSVSGWVAARKPNHGPSGWHHLAGRRGTPLEIRLVLPQEGAALKGRVLGPDGNSVSRAILWLGSYDPYAVRTSDGTGLRSDLMQTRTDEQGRFELPSVLPGEDRRLIVRAPDLAPWSGTVDIPAHTVRAVEVRLQAGATVRGQALDADGSPATATVFAGSRIARLRTTVNAGLDGRFTLRGLAPGTVQLMAKSRELGWSWQVLELEPGERATWTARLQAGPSLIGRVVDDGDRPLSRLVNAWAQSPDFGQVHTGTVATDSDGNFTFLNCPDLVHTVRVRTNPETPAGAVQVTARPGDPGLVVRIDGTSRAGITVLGQVFDPDGRPVANAEVTHWDPVRGTGGFHELTDAGGRFRIGPLTRGRWQIEVRGRGYPVMSRWLDVEPPHSIDLGRLYLETPGFLDVVLRRRDEGPLDKVKVTATRDGASTPIGFRRTRDAAHSPPLAPGRYRLDVSAPGCPAKQRAFEIVRGRRESIEISLDR